MILDLVYHEDENNQPVFGTPPLTNFTGIALARDLIKRLGISSIIDEKTHVLSRHRPYHESDYVLTQVYNFLTGGEVLNDIERLQNDKAFARIVGAETIPDPTTAGDFLVRFDNEKLERFREVLDTVQERTFSLMPKKQVADKRKKTISEKGKVKVASFTYQPAGWKKPYRFVAKRTEIHERDNHLTFDEQLCRYTYYIVVTNSTAADSTVINIAAGRGN